MPTITNLSAKPLPITAGVVLKPNESATVPIITTLPEHAVLRSWAHAKLIRITDPVEAAESGIPASPMLEPPVPRTPRSRPALPDESQG